MSPVASEQSVLQEINNILFVFLYSELRTENIKFYSIKSMLRNIIVHDCVCVKEGMGA